MAILINSQTGLAENVPDDQAHEFASAGSHEIPLNDPEGNPITVSLDQAQQLISQGYTQPSSHQLQNLMNYSKFSTPGEQLKTGLEGAAQALTFGASTGAERALGVNPEDIRGREETNPNVHMLGQVAGLAASNLIPGVGGAADAQAAARAAQVALKAGRITEEVAAPVLAGGRAAINPLSAQSVLSGAGERVAQGLGLGAPQSLLGQVGSAAAKGAVESALFQSGDEVSRMFAGDPNQSLQTAVTHIGLGGLLGAGASGAFGAVSPLWKVANETKLAQTLAAIKNKANGIGPTEIPSTIEALSEKAGLALTPEVRAAVSQDPAATRLFQDLMERQGTAAGRKTQESLAKFQQDARDTILTTLGKTKEELPSLERRSDFDRGQTVQKALGDELDSITGPISKKFEEYKTNFAGAALAEKDKIGIENAIGDLINQERLHVFPDLPQAKIANQVLKGIKNIGTLGDLGKIQSLIRNETQDPTLWNLGKKLVSVFRTAEEDMTTGLLGAKAPALIAEHAADRQAYKQAMDLIDNLNDRLHVGSYAGPGSFVSRLKEMKPEDIVRRLSSRNDAGLLEVLSGSLPKTAGLVRDNHLVTLLGDSVIKGELNNKALFGTLFDKSNAWSPELRKFVLPEGAEQRLSSIKQLMDAVPASSNPSHTAGTLDAMWAKLPAGIGGLLSVMTGHGILSGLLHGQLMRLATTEVPDAIKLATLKFLGSNEPISSQAFKTAVDLIASTIKGEHMMNAAVKSVFDASKAVLPTSAIPSTKSIQKLDAKLQQYQQDSSPLLDVGGKTPHYLPEHATSMGVTVQNSVQYLNGIRPTPVQKGILDPPIEPTPLQKQEYDRALQIAEQPLVVLSHLQKGTLVPQDVQTIKTIYPDLYSRLNEKLMNQVIDVKQKGKMISYGTRMSLSLFMGQPMDSTLMPESVMQIQSQFQPPQPQEAPKGSIKPTQGGMKNLNKLGQMQMTDLQAKGMHQRQHG